MESKYGRLKFWHQLDKRLIIIICITVIPINILAVSVSSIAVTESKAKVITSYKKDFDIFMNHEITLISKLEEWYQSFIAENLGIMTISNAFNSVKSINMIQALSTMLNVYGIKGFVFLQEHHENNRLYVKGTKDLYDAEQVENIKENLPYSYGQGAGLSNWHMEVYGERYYFFRSYSYLNYTIGFGIDLSAELMLWMESNVMHGSQVVLTDGIIAVQMDMGGMVSELSPIELETFLIKGRDTCIVSRHFGTEPGGMDVYLMITGFWGFVPSAYVVLQVLAFLSIFMLLILWYVIRKQVIRPLGVLQKGMGELEKNELHYRIEEKAETLDFGYIFHEFNVMANDILESHEKDLMLYQTRLDNLKLQVNPHMLLNSFTMIYSLAETGKYQLIQEYSMHLVDYFRYCLKETDTLVPLLSEMRFVENYIEIQKIRFPGEFTSVYTMEDDLEEAMVPPLLIQNFVENAMKYARIPERVIEVLINIRKSNHRLFISICDTGKGMEEAALECLNKREPLYDKNGIKHIGIWNCHRRLEAFFGQEAFFKITSTKGEGTQVWIELPYIEKSKAR